MPPELGQCAPFRMEEISRYDERGSAWYWNNISMGEHTGTHFDAPVHWISGKDLPTIPSTHSGGKFHRAGRGDRHLQAVGGRCRLRADRRRREAWEAQHGRIAAGSWVLLRTDWSKRSGRDYVNMREDGQHTPGPCPEVVRFLVEERDLHGLGTETIGTDAGPGLPFQSAVSGALLHARQGPLRPAVPRQSRPAAADRLGDPRAHR